MNNIKGISTIQAILVILIIAVLGVIVYMARSGDETAPHTDTTQAFGERVNYEIIGIDPGAGIMQSTEEALETYELEGWTLKTSSAAAMLTAVQDAVASEEPVIATVWEPHSTFAVADLRKLNDPQNIYNKPDQTRAFLEEFAPDFRDADVSSDVLASVVYKGFADDAPAAYAFLQEFNVPAETQSQWIFEFNVEDRSADDVATSYIEAHASTTETWLPADDVELGKETLAIGIPPWPGATVKSRVVRDLLEDIGYSVEVRELDPGIMYTSLADQQIDMTVAGWLPTTHKSYWEEKGANLEIAGINVTQTWLGLAVPRYVDESIQSIEDLRNQ